VTESRSLSQSAPDDKVAQAVAIGDVLYVPGTGGGLAEIGTAGGFMGHFMVVLSAPCKIIAGTNESRVLDAVWPIGAKEIWKISVLESARGFSGLSAVDLLMTLDTISGKFILFGEIGPDGSSLSIIEHENFELWQSPPNLRANLHPDLMREVAADMIASCGSWSITTAARALFRSASNFSSVDKTELLREIKACWGADPICTSVVIIFWQRYLCKLAERCEFSVDVATHPSDLILKFMPLKADRGLPGEVLRALNECGWTMVSSIPSSCHAQRARSTSWNVPSRKPDILKPLPTHRSSF
jgi:hypothetical protein